MQPLAPPLAAPPAPALPPKGIETHLFLERPAAVLICSLCDKVLNSPHYSCQNEHVACLSCIEEVRQEEMEEEEDGDLQIMECFDVDCMAYPFVEPKESKSLKRAIDQLRVYCPFKQHGCNWVGTVDQKAEHDSRCEYKIITCPNEPCGAKLRIAYLSSHRRTDCQYQKISCPLGLKAEDKMACVYLRKDKEDHELICHFHPCPVSGCPTVGTIEMIERHVNYCQDLHSTLEDVERELEELEEKQALSALKLEELQNHLDDSECYVDELQCEVDGFEEEHATMSKALEEAQEKLKKLEPQKVGDGVVGAENVKVEGGNGEDEDVIVENMQCDFCKDAIDTTKIHYVCIDCELNICFDCHSSKEPEGHDFNEVFLASPTLPTTSSPTCSKTLSDSTATEIRTKLTTLQTHLTSIDQKLTEDFSQTKALTRMENRLSKSEKTVKRRNAEIKTLTGEIKKLNEEIQKVSEERDKALEKGEDLNQELMVSEEEVRSLEEKLDEVIGEKDGVEWDLAEEQEKSEKEINELKKSLKEQGDTLLSTNGVVGVLRRKLASLEKELGETKKSDGPGSTTSTTTSAPEKHYSALQTSSQPPPIKPLFIPKDPQFHPGTFSAFKYSQVNQLVAPRQTGAVIMNLKPRAYISTTSKIMTNNQTTSNRKRERVDESPEMGKSIAKVPRLQKAQDEEDSDEGAADVSRISRNISVEL